MVRPKMILFDYGYTLLSEPDYDELRAEKELFKYIKTNKNGVTPEEAEKFTADIFAWIMKGRKYDLELHERQFQRFIYEYLGIEFTISLEEAEKIYCDSATPGGVMPGAENMLDYINSQGIRSAVVSNILWSGDEMRDRLNRLLPDNQFEFVITSSDYMFRKPNRLIFELALRKAGLSADEVWFCGDNPHDDIFGAAGAGILPVWYTSSIECHYRDKSKDIEPDCMHIHINCWDELVRILKETK